MDAEVIEIGWRPDGSQLSGYVEGAKRYGVPISLIATRETLDYRAMFDAGVDHHYERIVAADPYQPASVLTALRHEGVDCTGARKLVVLPSGDAFVEPAYELSKMIPRSEPVASAAGFEPPNKLALDRILRAQPGVRHLLPKRVAIDLGDIISVAQGATVLGYPVVIKAANSSAGHGIIVVEHERDLLDAVTKLRGMKTMSGQALADFFLEEFLSGHEVSLQGTVEDGVVSVLSRCTKIVFTVPLHSGGALFRESGHVAASVASDDPICVAGRAVIKAVGYRSGVFQMDFVHGADGHPRLLEVGYRPSGQGVRRLTAGVSGYDLGAEAARIALHQMREKPQSRQPVMGHLNLSTSAQQGRAQMIAAEDPRAVYRASPVASVSDSQVPPGLLDRHRRSANPFGSLTVSGSSQQDVFGQLLSVIDDVDLRRLKPIQIVSPSGTVSVLPQTRMATDGEVAGASPSIAALAYAE